MQTVTVAVRGRMESIAEGDGIDSSGKSMIGKLGENSKPTKSHGHGNLYHHGRKCSC